MKFQISNFQFLAFCFLCLLASLAPAATPVSASVTNLFGEEEDYISQADYFWGTTLLLTNCIAYAGSTTSSPRQDLTGRTLQLKIGSISSNLSYTAYPSDASNGLWWASIIIPTNWAIPKIQLTIDPTNSPIIYQPKLLKAKQPL